MRKVSRFFRKDVFCGLIVVSMAAVLVLSTISFSQQGREVSITAYYSIPYAAYGLLRTRRIQDVDIENGITFVVDPDGESILNKIHLIEPASATTDEGDLQLDGKIHGLLASPNQYYVDLNWNLPPPGYMTQPMVDTYVAGIYVNSIRAENFIYMGAQDPYVWGVPVQGKHVYDIAEGMRADNCDVFDVVVISEDEDFLLVKSKDKFDTKVAGVISEMPKLYMGADPALKPLALAGIVKCNVTAENGPIKRGDLLVTSSEPGYAMRVEPSEVKPGMLLGKALQVLEKGKGKIYILVNKR